MGCRTHTAGMLPPIPRSCAVLVIEGIPGAGKTTLQERLRHQARDRMTHVYSEEALLFHWMHAWIPGIQSLRLQVLQQMLAHIEATLADDPAALFLLTRFHLSHALLGGDADSPAYRQVLAQLAALGAEVWVPVVPAADIAARAMHVERADPLWKVLQTRRLVHEGHADFGAMYRYYQDRLLALLEQQPLAYHLLPPSGEVGIA